ncbi:MAG: VOC family protein [Pseudomonadota bacterium]
MVKARLIDHICIAVRDLAQARKLYEERLGFELDHEYISESEKIKVARYYLGDTAMELMESTTPDGDVARFIDRRGEGLFLISYRVDDVEAALAEYRDRGEKTIDSGPREIMGARYAFIHPPKEMCGVLTELIDGEYKPEK